MPPLPYAEDVPIAYSPLELSIFFPVMCLTGAQYFLGLVCLLSPCLSVCLYFSRGEESDIVGQNGQVYRGRAQRGGMLPQLPHQAGKVSDRLPSLGVDNFHTTGYPCICRHAYR